MLVLARRVGEIVMLGNEIQVRVLSFSGNQVRLGFTAPPDLPIHREEIYRLVQAERRQKDLHYVAEA